MGGLGGPAARDIESEDAARTIAAVVLAVPDGLAAELFDWAPAASLQIAWYPRDDPLSVDPSADVLWWDARPHHLMDVVARAPRLRWLTTVTAGMDGWPLSSLTARGVVVTNGAGLSAVPISEHVIALALIARHRLMVNLRGQLVGRWDALAAGGGELNGCRALILGYGGIGREVAKGLRALGVDVTGVRRRPAGRGALSVHDSWRDLLPELDLLVLTLPLTSDTRHLVAAPELARLKDGCWVINVGRGAVIDEQALEAELVSGRIGAALDVFEHEPLPPDSPLWKLPNVVVTPHCAGQSDSVWWRGAERLRTNLDRYRQGRRLIGTVDPDAGY